MHSDAPDWLVELVRNQMRLMSASPQSVADAVWWELQRHAEIRVADHADL